ncbi:enolase C-terminal domain-like protein [Microbacterium sulfonylureivorans]|uniref:enolase C-terminal domain-like protein n=1 Tax=Microbacterium sulfonylureivorans TaxID=2486854 RepID=UPI000FD90323|nr:enolase C-terminal domain-like protein [Microbacterium sulfonylureivorans]
MKIIAVEVVRVRIPAYSPAFVWRDGLPGSEPELDGAWLVVRTDEGIDGLSFTLRGAILQDIVDRRLRAELLGQDPLAREYLWHRLWEIDRIDRFPVHIIGVVDIAIWDIGAKAAKLPLAQLLGSFRTSIPAYASTVTFGSIEEYLDVADQCLELGFPAIKLHAWGDARRDAELSLALREHVGPDVPLMYDGSAAFDLLDATYLGRALSEADYLWYEEPMKEFSVTAYQRLAERVDVPLLVCEVAEGAHMATADYIASGCASAVRAGSLLRGGVTGAMRIAHLADSFHLRAEVHGGGLVNTHLCMAIKNTTYYEALVDSPQVVRPAEVDANGDVHALTAPGVGWESQWAVGGAPQELLDIGIRSPEDEK